MPTPADQRHDRSASAVPHAGDLAVAGAIPATFVAGPAMADSGDGPTHSISTKSAASPSAPSDQANDVAITSAAAGSGGLVAPTMALASAPAVVGVAAPATEAPVQNIHSATIAPFVPMPHGAGAPDTVAMGQAVSVSLFDVAVPGKAAPATVEAVTAVPTTIDIAALDAVRSSVATLQESLAALAERLPDASNAVQPTIDAAQSLVAQTLDSVQDHVGGAAAAVAAQLTDTVTNVSAATQALTAPLLGHVDAISEAAGDTVATVAQSVTGLLDEGFAGHDPASGITTLVSMVSAADAFGLHDTASGVGEALTPALGALGAADLLADVAPIDALLGVSDHHETHGLADLDGLLGHG